MSDTTRSTGRGRRRVTGAAPGAVAGSLAAAEAAATTLVAEEETRDAAVLPAASPDAGTAVAAAEPPAPDTGAPEDEEDTDDFVTFAIGEEMFVFPMDRVQEIIRVPETVRVPLSPPSLDGLANLRSRVLPIVSLRSCIGYEALEHADSTRVIVVDVGMPLGFVVDRVAAVVSVDPSEIEDAGGIRATVDSELLTGVIRRTDDRMMAILDVERLVDLEFQAVTRGLVEREAAHGQAAAEPSGDDDSDDDTLEVVSFVVEEQEYALPIDHIQEIVQAPEVVSEVPNADRRVVGVMDLRGRLLPVISLRTIFGLPQPALEESNRVVVVPLRDDEGAEHTMVGVLMDTVREVLRVPQELVEDLPDVVSPAGGTTEVASVCRLDDGRRLVSVLSVERLFRRNGLRAAVEEHAGESADVADLDATAADVAAEALEEEEDDLLIVFKVADEEYCISVDAVQEIIRVPDELIRVPKSLDYVEGLVNLRGSVLPVVDLRTRLGIVRGERDDLQRIVVVIIDGARTGFVVDSVVEVLKLERGLVERAPELSEEQARVISRVANLEDQKRMLMVIDSDELLSTGDRDALAEAVAAV